MKVIHPYVYTNDIYIIKYCKTIHQPQRRMHPTLKENTREELQKL